MPLAKSVYIASVVLSAASPFSLLQEFTPVEQSTHPILLVLTQESGRCKVGQPCLVKVTLTNISNEVVRVRIVVGELATFMNYGMDVKRKDGKPVAQRNPLNPGNGEIIAPMFSEYKVPFTPGQSTYESFQLGDVARIDRPGTYLIKVQRDNRGCGPFWTATSNTLAVTYTR